MILLWGVPGDSPLDAVHAALLRRGAPTLLLDQRDTDGAALELEIGARLSGSLRVGQERVELESITGLYLRPQDLRARRASPEGTPAAKAGAALDDALLAIAELAPALVLNRPQAMAANGSKPYQYAQIAAAGFAVPETLITTTAQEVREFVAEHGRVVYKSISGVRSIVGELGPEDEPRLEDVAWCPTQFQRWIPGSDVRVHVVGERLFACDVRSDAIDYRYAPRSGHGVAVSDYQLLPSDCAERCLALSRATELTLAGIDLRRTPDGEWYCFEINPSPGFTYYEEAAEQPIAAAIAELLAVARGCDPDLTPRPPKRGKSGAPFGGDRTKQSARRPSSRRGPSSAGG